MGIEFDEKGKIFTNVVTKRATPVIIQTTTQRIQGNIHIPPDVRIKDEINKPDQFLAITDAKIIDGQGDVLYKASLVILNRATITWLVPEEEIQA